MRLVLSAVIAALVLVSGAGSATHFTLRPVAQTARTVTLSWQRQPGADGYALIRNGVLVARTMKESTTTATFWKGKRYTVVILHGGKHGKLTRGHSAVYTPPPAVGRTRLSRLVSVPAPSPRFALRVVARTARTVTFAWKPQPGADGYRFVRDGAVVARTMKGSTTTATFWKGSRYAVDAVRLTAKVVVPIRRARAFVTLAPAKARRQKLVVVPAKKIDFRLRLIRQTPRLVTFAWQRQAAADGYRFIRNGVAVSQTFDEATTSATFWKGSRYAVEVLRRVKGKKVAPLWTALAYIAQPRGDTSSSTTAPTQGKERAGAKPSGSPRDEAPRAGSTPSPSNPTPAPTPRTSTPAPAPPPVPSPPRTPAPAPSPQVGPGGTVTLSGTYTDDGFSAALAVAPPGPLIVRGPFTVDGDLSINRPGIRIDGATIHGVVEFKAGATNAQFLNSRAQGFGISSADGVVIDGSVFDGGGQVSQNFIWAVPAPDPVNGFTIRNSTFENYTSEHTDLHSEALFIGGYARNGLIEGNTFYNNGNTAHIFFSWCAPNDCDGGGGRYSGDPRDPSNICVRGNIFSQTWEAYYHVMVRQENGGGIGTDDNIRIAPGQPRVSTTTSVPGRLVQLLAGDNLKFQLAC